MIKSIKGFAFRFFKANKFITLSSLITVMLSISLIITMAVFASNAKQSLVNEVQQLYGNMDLSVGYNPDQPKIINQSLLNQITSQKAIQQYSPVLLDHLKIDKIGTTTYTVGVENDELVKSKYKFNKDLEDNEVIIHQALSEALKVHEGDTIKIENTLFTIKEVLPDFKGTGPTIDMILLSRHTVQQHLKQSTGINNEAAFILIKVNDKSDVLPIANNIRQIDPEIRIDVAEENELLQRNLESLETFMIVLSALIIIVTSLLIISNFDILLYKYKNQFAIMRSIGATTKQMFKIILIQGSMINIIGGILGFFLALITNRFLITAFERLFSFKNSVSTFNYPAAFLVMIISMIMIELFILIPSLKSAKILPLKIIRDNEQNDFSDRTYGKKLGIFLLFSSLFFVLYGLAKGNSALALLISGLLFILGLFRLIPVYLSPILNWIAPILRLLFGKVTYVSIKNVVPQVRKNTFIVLSISTMLIITVFGTALLNTIKVNEQQYLKKEYPTNIIVTSRVGLNSTINPNEIKSKINDLKGVTGASTISTIGTVELIKQERTKSLDYALVDVKEMEKQGLIPSISENVKNIIILNKNFAEENSIKVGDRIQLGMITPQSRTITQFRTLVVASILERLPGYNYDAYMDWMNTSYRTNYTVFRRVLISSVSPERTLQDLKVLKLKYPAQLQISSYEQALVESEQMFYQRWSIFIAVILVMLISLMLGVFNSLINNIHSKRKEFAILRTISVSKNGIIQAVLTQVVLYILIGLIIGIAAGIIFTYILILIDPGQIYFDFTFISLISASLITMSFLIFVPFANEIGKKNITLELAQDNK